MVKKGAEFLTPDALCEHCDTAVGKFDWVVNGAGQICHYPECFNEIRNAAGGIRLSPTIHRGQLDNSR